FVALSLGRPSYEWRTHDARHQQGQHRNVQHADWPHQLSAQRARDDSIVWNSPGRSHTHEWRRRVAGYFADELFVGGHEFQLFLSTLFPDALHIRAGRATTRRVHQPTRSIRFATPGTTRRALHHPDVVKSFQLGFDFHEPHVGKFAKSHQQHFTRNTAAILARRLAALNLGPPASRRRAKLMRTIFRDKPNTLLDTNFRAHPISGRIR